MKRKILALLLTLAALMTLFTGCASSPALISYEGHHVTSNMYRYWLSTYKGSFMNLYSDMSDTDAFWDSVLYDDVTAEQYLNDAVIANVKRTLLCSAQFDLMGLEFPDSAAADIDAYIEDLINERADGSRNSFNQILGQYGINIDMLRAIFTMEDKTSFLFSYLYGENGPNALTDEDLENYCQEHYVRIRHIYVNNVSEYETDEEGNYVYDTSGSVITRTLTDEEKAAKNSTIEAIETAIASAATDFDTVYATYSEDQYYKNGYYLCATTPFISEVITASFGLEVGEITRVDSEHGVHFIMRIEMDEKPYENEENADFFADFETDAQNDHFLDWIEEKLPEVTVNTEEIQNFSIRDVVPNYSI